MPENYLYIFLLTVIFSVYSIYSSTKNDLSQQHFQKWKKQYALNYTQLQENYRQIMFAATEKQIQKHNQNSSNTYKMALNQFSALTETQFAFIYLKPIQFQEVLPITDKQETSGLLRKSNFQIDWVTNGRVSPVKNQGSCASCWAFSAVAMLQSFALSKRQTIYLSEQQLVDCSEDYGNSGCYGGFNFNALQYVIEKGIVQQKQYPYQAASGPCLKDGGPFKISKMHAVKGCLELHAAIQQRPLGVTVDATKWRTYGSGIFSNCDNAVNHDVLLVGRTSSYYKIKNSWGVSWGEQGYIRLALGDTCGICLFKSFYVQ